MPQKYQLDVKCSNCGGQYAATGEKQNPNGNDYQNLHPVACPRCGVVAPSATDIPIPNRVSVARPLPNTDEPEETDTPARRSTGGRKPR